MSETRWPKFRLKNDTPLHRAGEIFTKNETTIVASDGYETDTDLIVNFDEWFEEVPDEWPQAGKHYYTVRSDGGVISLEWLGDRFDEGSQAIGNVFKTEKSAHAYVDYLKAVTTVRQDEGVLTTEEADRHCVNGNRAYCLMPPGIVRNSFSVVAPGGIYFKDTESAGASWDAHRKEWQTIMSYDWSRE